MQLLVSKEGIYQSPDDPGDATIDGQPRWSVSGDEGLILGAMAKGLTVLEIGTGLGVSAKYMLVQARKVYTYDPDPWVRAQVYPELTSAGAVCLDTLAECPVVEMVFIDGDHSAEAVDRDTAIALSKRAPGGVLRIVYHDAKMDSVREGVRKHFRGWKVLNTNAGLGMVEVKSEEDQQSDTPGS